ncbi:hypothetical protein [Microbacterium sp.]|uniref:hypothetical protein n=1 Tax=Microbacterium sp. TaxID=51671 RepID=UPI003A8690F8
MVAHVLGLRLSLLVGAFRGGRSSTVRAVAATAAALIVTLVVCSAALHMRSIPASAATAASVLVGAATVLACAGAPLVGGMTDPLDPRRFAVLNPAPRALAGTLLVASLVSIPVACLIAICVCVVVMWTAHGVAPASAVLSAALGALTCILSAKLAAGANARMTRERTTRPLGIFLIAVVVVAVPVAVFLAVLARDGVVPAALQRVVDVVALTPFGAAWALPDPASGGWSLAVAVVTVALLVGGWYLVVDRLLHTVPRPRDGAVEPGRIWFAITPPTPTGSIAARSLVYWFTDPRYRANVIIIPVAAVVAAFPLLLVGVPVETALLLPAPLMALFLGWLAHNDLAYDASALWLHLSAGVRGTADRVGRLVPVVVIAVPLLLITLLVTGGLIGQPRLVPAVVGVSLCLFLCGLGVSSVASVAAPYAVAGPGDSPFQQPQRTGGTVIQGIALALILVLNAPALWWGWLTLTGDDGAATAALWGGTAIGLVVAVAGVLLGGWVFERRGGALMEFAVAT